MQGQEDGDSILPFAKCSRVVSRASARSLPSQSSGTMLQAYGDSFWEDRSQRPSSSWMLEQPVPPALATGRSQPGLHSLEGLPPPERLCRRKRKKLHSERVQRGPGNMPARVRAVTYHLEDLRRRQGITNELKKAQWGSCGAPPQLLVLEEGCGLFSTAGCLDVEDRAACPQEESHFVTPRDQLLWSPWTPLGQGWTYASGRPSSLAYSTVTARRNPICDVQRMEELESEE
ncbi:protein INCA1 isoform X2 [Psammomys obesus]|uniref:protein INCA1 isoform X2 n=1 Tax=Psammomys obesus TaxID=48139 RepID=UPI0024533B00|nr:protein INCA1 isoform X2 [Psammomys obesus]